MGGSDWVELGEKDIQEQRMNALFSCLINSAGYHTHLPSTQVYFEPGILTAPRKILLDTCKVHCLMHSEQLTTRKSEKQRQGRDWERPQLRSGSG